VSSSTLGFSSKSNALQTFVGSSFQPFDKIFKMLEGVGEPPTPESYMKPNNFGPSSIFCLTLIIFLLFITGCIVQYRFVFKHIRNARRKQADEERVVKIDIDRQTKKLVRPKRQHKPVYFTIPRTMHLPCFKPADSYFTRHVLQPRIEGEVSMTSNIHPELARCIQEPVTVPLDEHYPPTRTGLSGLAMPSTCKCVISKHTPVNEMTPLLPILNRCICSAKSRCRKSFLQRTTFLLRLRFRYTIHVFKNTTRVWTRKVHSWLMYQPEYIPFTTLEAPPNGTSLAIIAMLAIQLFFLFISVTVSKGLLAFLACLAQRSSCLYATNLPVYYFLGIKYQPLAYLAGLPFERLKVYRRRLEEYLYFLVLIHVFGYISVWATHLAKYGETLPLFSSISTIYTGLAALFLCSLYYWFKFSYWLNSAYHHSQQYLQQPVFMISHIILFLHAPFSRPFIITSMIIYIIDYHVIRECLTRSDFLAMTKSISAGKSMVLSINRNTRPESR
jgi:hypothetical protein